MSPLTRANLARLGEAKRQVRPLVDALAAIYRTPCERGAIPLHALLHAASAARARVLGGPTLLLGREAATTLAGVLHALLADHGAPARLRWRIDRGSLRLELRAPFDELAAGLARAELRDLDGRLFEQPGRLGIELPITSLEPSRRGV